MIAKCKCAHKAQDELHGPGNRVWNVVPATAKKPAVMRCTVCGVEKDAPRTKEADKKAA